MYELIEAELARVREMAEVADEAYLVYLIEVAIIQARARSSNDSLEALIAPWPEHRDRRLVH